jgi:hypothetical protein
MDNCDGALPVMCTPPSGSTFAEGVTTVTCVASDSSGNSNSCTFTVSVIKVQDPQITDFKVIGSDIVLSFTALIGGQCTVQTAETAAGPWTDALTGIAGSSGIVTVTNLGVAAFPPRFFRVKLSLP